MPFSGSAAAGSIQGSVTRIDTGAGLIGGPITDQGTISIGSVTATQLIGSVSLTNQVSGVLPVANGGIISTSWVAFAPTLNNAISTIATANVSMWRRVGDTLEVQGGFTMPGATSSSDAITHSIPATLTIDTTKISSAAAVGNATSPMLGPSLWFQAGTGWRPLYSTYGTTTTLRLFMIDQPFASSQLQPGDGVHFKFSVPIVEWG